MFTIRHLLAAACVLGGLPLLPGTAHAAQSYDNCTGFIDSVPATISKAGVWCLRKDVSTANTSGEAIRITANNVTIDCNDFKIGGLAAGNASQTNGIYADNRQNVTARHCNVRGFHAGIHFTGGAGHLVEDNRLDNNLYIGIWLDGSDTSLVQRNRVFDTGGSPNSSSSYGIAATADIIDNTVDGVFAAAATTNPIGIWINRSGRTVQGNRIRGLAAVGRGGIATGIHVVSARVAVDGNQVMAAGTTPAGVGIRGASAAATGCSNNTVGGFSSNYVDCAGSVNNLSL